MGKKKTTTSDDTWRTRSTIKGEKKLLLKFHRINNEICTAKGGNNKIKWERGGGRSGWIKKGEGCAEISGVSAKNKKNKKQK